MNDQTRPPSAPRPPVLEVSDLRRVYRMGDTEVAALDGVDLRVDEGEFIAIVGPSGSGKSTLMYVLGLLDRPTGGSYRLDGREVSSLPDHELSALRNRAIGFVFQQYNLLPDIDVVDNVAVGLNYAGVDRDRRRAIGSQLLETVGLAHRIGHTPRELSGGQMQRVAIARGLAMRPRIVLADEPTGNLDTKTGDEIMTMFRRLHAEGHTIILVTHEPEVAEEADRIVRIVDGKIVADGPSPALATRAAAAVENSTPGAGAAPRSRSDVPAEGAMRVRDVVRIALREGLLSHKLRTMLTMLGIVFGIASVIAMTAITEGGKQQQLEQIRQIGLNNIQIHAADLDGARLLRERRKNAFGLHLGDLEEIRRHVDGIQAATAWRGVKAQLRHDEVVLDDVRVLGVHGDFPAVSNVSVAHGRFLDIMDSRHRQRVCVVGHGLVRRLGLEPAAAEGATLILGDEPFTVIGVMAPKDYSESSIGDISITDRNQELYLPLASLDSYYRQEELASQLDTISLRMASEDILIDRSRLIERVVGSLHNQADDFAVSVPLEILRQTQRTKEIFNVIIVVIAAMALIVGGIGIMNIMLANVTERTREIGIRRAVGASRRDILRQFLTEALTIACIGGLIGLAVGIAGGLAIEAIFGFPVAYSTTIMVIAEVVSIGIGVVFGLYPALQAAHRDPVEALRS